MMIYSNCDKSSFIHTAVLCEFNLPWKFDRLQSQESVLSPGSSTVDMSDADNILGDETKTTNWFLPGRFDMLYICHRFIDQSQ